MLTHEDKKHVLSEFLRACTTYSIDNIGKEHG